MSLDPTEDGDVDFGGYGDVRSVESAEADRSEGTRCEADKKQGRFEPATESHPSTACTLLVSDAPSPPWKTCTRSLPQSNR